MTCLRQSLLNAAFFLAAINFITENMGCFSDALNRYLGLFFLAGILLNSGPTTWRKTHIGAYGISVCLALTGLWLTTLDTVYALIAVTLLILSALQLPSLNAEKKSELFVCLIAALGYGVIVLAYTYLLPVWFAGNRMAAWALESVNLLPLPVDVNYGITYTGLKISGSFLLFISALFVADRDRQPFRFAMICLLVLLLTFIYMHLVSLLFILKDSDDFRFRLLTLYAHPILFAMLLIPLCLSTRRTRLVHRRFAINPTHAAVLVVAVCLVAADRQMTADSRHEAGSGKKIVFFDDGHLDWKVPEFGRYGGRQGGMFGVLRRYLIDNGFDVLIAGISQASLADADALVLINLNRRLDPVEKDLVWQFVGDGGGLLVLGDHTGMDHIRQPYNELLSPVGIRFNFDSAMSLAPKWMNALQIRPHFITREIHDRNDLQIWIGASLSISYPAKPVIIGKYAFSDHGNRGRPQFGYLGDMRYSLDERLGDVILAAENFYKTGRVLVFGDTSSFQNSALAFSSQFVDAIFAWLCAPRLGGYPWKQCCLYSMLIAGVAWAVLTHSWSAILIRFVFVTAGLVFMVLSLADMRDRPLPRSPAQDIAYVDISHLEKFSRDLWGEPDGIGGLIFNLMRNGYFPKVLKEITLPTLQQGKLLILISPSKPFSHKEIETISAFLQAGGFLVLTVGWEEKEASQRLLDRYRITIGNVPLGRVPPELNDKGLYFHEAWPVTVKGDGADYFCTAWGYPIIAFIPHGKGGMAVIGDSAFLLNQNLEGLNNYVVSNIVAFKDLNHTYFRPAAKVNRPPKNKM